MTGEIRHLSVAAMVAATVLAAACGDDDGPGADAGGGTGTTDAGTAAGTDAGTALDAGDGAGTTDAGTGGGSTVGMLCANDTNCTGAGEVCCLESAPYVCTLAADCDSTSGGIPCESRADCPSSRVCCRLPTDQFCTTRNACADFGGDEVP